MKFKFKADCIFEAEDLMDAFEKIHEHFLQLSYEDVDESKTLKHIGELSIEPIEEELPPTLNINVSDHYPAKDKFGR